MASVTLYLEGKQSDLNTTLTWLRESGCQVIEEHEQVSCNGISIKVQLVLPCDTIALEQNLIVSLGQILSITRSMANPSTPCNEGDTERRSYYAGYAEAIDSVLSAVAQPLEQKTNLN